MRNRSPASLSLDDNQRTPSKRLKINQNQSMSRDDGPSTSSLHKPHDKHHHHHRNASSGSNHANRKQSKSTRNFSSLASKQQQSSLQTGPNYKNQQLASSSSHMQRPKPSSSSSNSQQLPYELLTPHRTPRRRILKTSPAWRECQRQLGASNRSDDSNGPKQPDEQSDSSGYGSSSQGFVGGIGVGINFDKFDKIEVKVSGRGIQNFTPFKTFEEAGLREFLLDNARKSGYTKPTPVQESAVRLIMMQHNLVCCSPSESGKTIAFCLPILHMIMSNDCSHSPNEPLCLIVAPTRKSVIQIFNEARKFALDSWVKIEKAYGSTTDDDQVERIRNCHLLIATPDRLMDFVNKGVISFNSLRILVLDEADRTLDMGFKSAIDEICGHSTLKKEQVQTLLFSATFPDDIQRLAATYLRDYVFLAVGKPCRDETIDVVDAWRQHKTVRRVAKYKPGDKFHCLPLLKELPLLREMLDDPNKCKKQRKADEKAFNEVEAYFKLLSKEDDNNKTLYMNPGFEADEEQPPDEASNRRYHICRIIYIGRGSDERRFQHISRAFVDMTGKEMHQQETKNTAMVGQGTKLVPLPVLTGGNNLLVTYGEFALLAHSNDDYLSNKIKGSYPMSKQKFQQLKRDNPKLHEVMYKPLDDPKYTQKVARYLFLRYYDVLKSKPWIAAKVDTYEVQLHDHPGKIQEQEVLASATFRM